MVQSIDDLRDIDDEIFEEFKKATLHLPFLLNKSEQNRTAEVCFMYMSGTNFLKNSIFDCAESEDYYSLSVLLRSLIEHFLRFNYFWFNYSKIKEDSYSLKFIVSLEFHEKLTIENAINAAKLIKYQEAKTSDQIWEEIKNSNPTFEVFTKQEIDDFSKSLSIKNIIRYIEKNMKEGGLEIESFLQQRIVQYAQLSSFVHGGLYAHKQMIELETSKQREKTVLVICGVVLQMAASIKLFSYLIFFQRMPEFRDIYNKTEELIKKVK